MSLYLSKCHNAGNLMSRLICVQPILTLAITFDLELAISRVYTLCEKLYKHAKYMTLILDLLLKINNSSVYVHVY